MSYSAKSLVDQIKVIQDNTTYNVFNILKGLDFEEDPYWTRNRRRLIRNSETIFGIYFNMVKSIIPLTKPTYSPGHLKMAIQKYIDVHQPRLPEASECCVYFRVGDKTVDVNSLSMLDFDYIEKIAKRPNDTITIVCCFSFSCIREEWYYSDSRLNSCRDIMTGVIDNIIKSFPNSKIQLVSNSNVDHDICYLWKNGFIAHKRSSWKKLFGCL